MCLSDFFMYKGTGCCDINMILCKEYVNSLHFYVQSHKP